MKRFFILCAVAVSVVVLLTAGSSSAAAWPQKGKMLTFYILAGAGGGSDMAGRNLATFLEKELGIKIVIINKPGGGSQVGMTEYMAKAGTDGYTIAMTTLPSTHGPYLDPDRKATYKRKDFTLVANFAWSPVAMGAKKGRYKTLKDVVDAAKAAPDKVKITAAGPLTPADYGIILFEKAAGIKVGHMFFDQQGEQRACLLGDHCDVESNLSFELIPGQKSGEIETLAILDTKRDDFFPGIPTADEQGYKGMVVGYGAGLSYKTGTPKAIIDRVAKAVEKIGKDPEYQAMCKKVGLAPTVYTGKQYEEVWKNSENIVQGVLNDMKKKK